LIRPALTTVLDELMCYDVNLFIVTVSTRVCLNCVKTSCMFNCFVVNELSALSLVAPRCIV